MTTRRNFLKGTGSIVLYFNLMPTAALAQQSAAKDLPTSLAANPALDAWLRIAADGTVTLSPGKCEIGQGIQTALAQIAAEELDVALERVHVVTVDTSYSPDEAYTTGSRSVEHSGAAIRMAAAEIRSILVDLAADELDVDSDRIDVLDGTFMVDGRASRLGYRDVVKDRTLARNASGTAAPKSIDDYRVVEKSAQRIDIPGKAFGETSFLQDLRFDGMLHARVVRTGQADAKLTLKSGFESVAKMAGVVKIVRDGSFLAVVAEREEQSIAAAARLADFCEWDQIDLPITDQSALPDWLSEARADVRVVAEGGAGDVKGVVRTISNSYSRPFLAHASLSPSIAIAKSEADLLTVWSHSQGVYPLRRAISTIVGLAEDRIRLIHAQAAGCYGHNGADDAAADAAVVAMQIPGRPIRLQWSRADEFSGEPYGSAMRVEISAGLNASNAIVDWNCDIWSGSHTTRPDGGLKAGNLFAARQKANPLPMPPVGDIPLPRGGADRNSIPLYTFAHHRVTKHLLQDMPLRTTALRGLGAYANVFAIESFMDEIAQAQGEDPIDFRIRQLDDHRAIGVLEGLREKMAVAGMHSAAPPAGVGVAMARYKNTGAYCAIAMGVTVEEKTGNLRLDRAVCVVDVGLAINPDGVINQIEGGIIQASSWTVKEQLSLSREGVKSNDWASYPILTFSEVPAIEVTLVDQRREPALGAGEASQGPTSAAIGNAVSRATGKRIRDLPISPQRLRQT